LNTWFSSNSGLPANRGIRFATQRIPHKFQLFRANSACFGPIKAIKVVFELHWQTHCNFRKREGATGTLTAEEIMPFQFLERPFEFSGGRAPPCKMAKPPLPTFRRNRHRRGIRPLVF